MDKITPEQEENLRKHSAYLKSKKLKASFAMHTYCEGSQLVPRSDCGSVGCSIGHASYSIGPKHPNECWEEYSTRIFGLSPWDPSLERDWGWLFDGDWWEYDDTPDGAARRIDYLLEHGEPPEDFKYDHICNIEVPERFRTK